MAWPAKLPAPAAYFTPLLHPATGEPCPVPARGWRNPPATMARLVAEGRVAFGPDARTQPTRRTYLDEVLREPVPSVLASAASDDALLARLGLAPFAYAKPVEVLARLLEAAAPAPDAVVGDLFAGSGSTAHALLLRDATDGGERRCVLVEHDPAVVEVHLLPRLARLLADPPGTRRWRAVRIDRLPAVPARPRSLT
jgi:adenine-specific DNA-methyltransferase